MEDKQEICILPIKTKAIKRYLKKHVFILKDELLIENSHILKFSYELNSDKHSWFKKLNNDIKI